MHTIPLKKVGRKSKRPLKYEFELNYYVLDRTAEDLAKKYGVKTNTIYQWARQFKSEGGDKQEKDPAA